MTIHAEQTITRNERTSSCLLIVDDEAGVRIILRDLFEGYDYEVIEAADGQEALKMHLEHSVDLVITDVNMPTKTGLELLHELHQRDPELPVIMITGKPTVEAAVECIRTGATDFITKPFDLLEIGKRVETALEERRRSCSEALSGTLMLNYSDRRSTSTEYKIVRALGQGNMGTVYLVTRDPDDGRQYAMKVLRTAGLAGEQKFSTLERFRREAESARMVEHPNVVVIHDYGTAANGQDPYIVMEYIEGRSLKFLIRHGGLDLNAKSKILWQVASALQAIHKAGICHRDVKPGNIIVNDELNAKVTDFGIARLPGSDLTLTTSFVGSPAYMSPEAYISAKVDHRADIFSLGVVAYEFYLGQKPFGGENLPQMMNAIRTREPIPPHDVDPTLPEELVAMLYRMLEKNPDTRYQDLEEAIEILRAFA